MLLPNAYTIHEMCILWVKCILWHAESQNAMNKNHFLDKMHFMIHKISFILVCKTSLQNAYTVHEMCIMTCILFTKGVYKIKNTFTLTCMKCKTIVHKSSIGFKIVCMKLCADFSIPLIKCNFLLSFCVHALKYSCIFVSQNSFSLQN